MPKFNQRPRRERLHGEEWLFNKGGELWPDGKGAERDWQSVKLDEAMARLPEPYRSALEMRFYGRLTHAEIAQELGWKDRRWTAVYVKRGLEMLREDLLPQLGSSN